MSGLTQSQPPLSPAQVLALALAADKDALLAVRDAIAADVIHTPLARIGVCQDRAQVIGLVSRPQRSPFSYIG